MFQCVIYLKGFHELKDGSNTNHICCWYDQLGDLDYLLEENGLAPTDVNTIDFRL